MTTDPESVTIVLRPHEAASGSVQTITTSPGAAPVTIQTPPGVADGTIINYPGAGTPNPATGLRGDLLVRISVGTDPAPAAPPPSWPQPIPQPVPAEPPPVPTGPMTPLTPPAPAGRSNSVRLALIAVGVVAVLLIGCCSVSTWLVLRGGDDKGSGATAAGPSADPSASGPDTTAAPPLTPEAYQQRLTGVDGDLKPAFDQVRATKNPAALDDGLADASGDVRDARDALAAVTPPAAAGPAHAELVAGLTALTVELMTRGVDARASKVCAGAGALPALGRSTAAERVRAAVDRLAKVDPARAYRFGAFLPKSTPDTDRRLKNGQFVKRGPTNGAGRLKIENSEGDAVLSLVRDGGKAPVTIVYLRSKSSHTFGGIKDGTYRVYLTKGEDWDSGAKAFTRDCMFAKFDDPMKFTTGGGTYTQWTLSLAARAGGNASTSTVDPESFPTG